MIQLAGAAIGQSPFPHLVVDAALPAEQFEELRAIATDPDLFEAKGRGLKLELDVADTALPFQALARSQQSALRGLQQTVRESAPAIADTFSTPLLEKYRWLLGPALSQEILAEGWTTTNGRLMGRSAGYQLRPHLDSAHFGVTCLLYFSEAATVDEGALGLYVPSRPPDVLDASTYYPDKSEGIDSTLGTVIQIRPNRFVAFVCSPVSLHGFGRAPHTAGWRFVYQCHVVPAGLRMDTLLPRLTDPHRGRWERFFRD